MDAVLTRDKNSATVNDSLADEMLYVSPKIADVVEQIDMNIAEGGTDFIFEMLSDLSSNRGAYALREAYSNAYDATVLTGDMTRPIEIAITDPEGKDKGIAASIADALSSSFEIESVATIRDHGIGMSTDDVKRFFTQYGGSKKRESENTVGSKGLGSKAPLACADAFMVESTKDGITTTAIIERKGGGNTASIRTEPTGAESGTTITIPISDSTTYKQMIDCAKEITRWNLDAKITYNGEVTEPTFVEEVFGSKLVRDSFYHKDEDDFVYLGNIEVAKDDKGEPISFRMWQNLKCFANKEPENIALSLAGVHYQLWGGDRGWCELVIAGEPGYLNFTPSRDEIKDDDARRELVKAVIAALQEHDFSKTLEECMRNMDIYESSKWLNDKIGHASFTREGDKVVIQGFGGYTARLAITTYTISDSAFMKDGIDCLSLFAKEDKEKSDRARVRIAASIDGNYFAAENRTEYDKMKDDQYAYCRELSLTKRAKTESFFKGLESYTTADAFKHAGRRGCYNENKNGYYAPKMFVIDLGEKAEADECEKLYSTFLRNEKAVRDCFEVKGDALYIFVEAGQDLDALDEIALGGATNAVSATMDDLLEKANEYKREQAKLRKTSRRGTTSSKTKTEDLDIVNQFGGVVAGCTIKKGALYKIARDVNAMPVAPQSDNKYEDTYRLSVLPEEIVTLKDLARKCIVVLSERDTRYSSHMLELVAFINALVANGEVEDSDEIEYVAFLSMSADIVRAFKNAGGKIFYDERKRTSKVALADCIIESLGEKVSVEKCIWRNDIDKITVHPDLVYGKGTDFLKTMESSTFWHAEADGHDIYLMSVIANILKASGVDGLDEVINVLDDLIEYNAIWYSPIKFTRERKTDDKRTSRAYDRLKEAIKTVLGDIDLDSFYSVCYNEENGRHEIKLAKNADKMIGAVTDQIADLL